MSSAVSEKLAKPQLRGLLHSSIKRNLIGVGISIAVATVYMKLVHNKQRKDNYAEFYKHYDAEKAFESMRKKGLFDSCPSD